MLSEAINHQIYGKCNNPNGHGHNYNGMYKILVIITVQSEFRIQQKTTWPDPTGFTFKTKTERLQHY